VEEDLLERRRAGEFSDDTPEVIEYGLKAELTQLKRQASA
jgi:hypothetical protein